MPFSDTLHKLARTSHPGLVVSLLHIGFAFTGMGTVLLGSILPRVSAQWHLRDQDAGLLLLVQFASSASGALLARRNLWQTLSTGYALCGAGAAAILLLQQSAFPWLLLAFGAFGMGLGLAMTSTNLLVGRRHTQRRGAALALLNFSWSAGAVICPLIVTHFLPQTSCGVIFGLAGVVLSPFLLLPITGASSNWRMPAVPEPYPQTTREVPTVIYFALLAFLYVGVEATVGNWISTYASRTAAAVPGSSLARSASAVAVFWAALLLGRGVTPVFLTVISERLLYRAAVCLVTGGVAWLLFANNDRTVLGAAIITGFALAPIFPLIIALLLAEVGASRHAGWVFAVAGLGGAILSWLTGVVSTFTGSLRIGLIVPFAGALLMTILAARRSASQATLHRGG